jgi:hypothetical protein
MKEFWRGANRKIISIRMDTPKAQNTSVVISSLSDRYDEENIKD